MNKKKLTLHIFFVAIILICWYINNIDEDEISVINNIFMAMFSFSYFVAVVYDVFTAEK